MESPLASEFGVILPPPLERSKEGVSEGYYVGPSFCPSQLDYGCTVPGSQGLPLNKKHHQKGSGSAFPTIRMWADFEIMKKVRLNSLVFLFRLRMTIHI